MKKSLRKYNMSNIIRIIYSHTFYKLQAWYLQHHFQIELLILKFGVWSGFIPGEKCKCLKVTVANSR